MISAFQEISLIDYHGCIASVVFIGGCDFRCPFCHNRELVLHPNDVGRLSTDEVIGRIEEASKLVEGVVVTGGEPTLWDGLTELLTRIKSEGLKTKLDTNGSRPEVLRELLRQNLLDFIAMDIKTSIAKYALATGTSIDENLIIGSIDIIKSSGICHEFRTTCVPGLVDESDIESIGAMLGKGQPYALQAFRPERCLDPSYNAIKPYSPAGMESLKNAAVRSGLDVHII